MNAFDKLIGYESVKKELLQICDMFKYKEIYEKMGAKPPKGILLYGDPGLGKTLMGKCFIEESGMESYVVRRNKGEGNFIEYITNSFTKAKDNAPSIVFLDDVDKFANEDETHRNAEEYVAVQAAIDDVKDSEVFVFATVNNIGALPDSLTRSGRFDRKIRIDEPTLDDAKKIIGHYLKDKPIEKNLNRDDLVKMVASKSCAELETILNEAAISAAYGRRECIESEDIINAVLKMQYGMKNDYMNLSYDKVRKVALHEAGHLVACEVLCPKSVGLVSLSAASGRIKGGLTHRFKELPYRHYNTIILLAGKAAVELYYSDVSAEGCCNDVNRASLIIRNGISMESTHGLTFFDVEEGPSPSMSESFNSRSEAVVHAELERYYIIAKNILLKNRDFLENITEVLIEKKTLLYSDIQEIREKTEIIDVPA